MRLIDADELMEHVWRDKLDSRELIAQMVENAPTVKETKDKILKVMTRDEIKDELCRMLSDVVNGGYPKRSDTQKGRYREAVREAVKALEPKTGHCKECKYFEYDNVAKVDGIPLIVAHEICSRWGDGCKTNENGYCFLFEPQEKVGHWIPRNSFLLQYKCSECGYKSEKYHYCPNCGAKMEGEEDKP